MQSDVLAELDMLRALIIEMELFFDSNNYADIRDELLDDLRSYTHTCEFWKKYGELD